MEDAAILDLFFARDEAAIKETAAKYGMRLCRLSESITGDGKDAEECVNDTYLAAWNAIPPTRPVVYYAFLCRIVRNLSLNRFDRSRAEKRKAEVVSLTAEMEEVVAGAGEYENEHSEIAEILDRFLRELDGDTRLIFIRRYFYGDPIAALAAMTGLSENSLYARLFRARKKLSKRLFKEGIFV